MDSIDKGRLRFAYHMKHHPTEKYNPEETKDLDLNFDALDELEEELQSKDDERQALFFKFQNGELPLEEIIKQL